MTPAARRGGTCSTRSARRRLARLHAAALRARPLMTSRRLGDIRGRVREARKTSGGPPRSCRGIPPSKSSPRALVVSRARASPPRRDVSRCVGPRCGRRFRPPRGRVQVPRRPPRRPGGVLVQARVRRGRARDDETNHARRPRRRAIAPRGARDVFRTLRHVAAQRDARGGVEHAQRVRAAPARPRRRHEDARGARGGGRRHVGRDDRNVLGKRFFFAEDAKTPRSSLASVRPPSCLRLWIRDGNTTSRWTRVYSRCV